MIQCRVAKLLQNTPAVPIDPVPKPRVALLVDGENISAREADDIIFRAVHFGSLTTLRTFCKRTNPNGWDSEPRFEKIYVDCVSGKNTVDICLAIDALDILHERAARNFVIVSTDSDFTPLAHRLRRAGCGVLGMGRSETTDRFRMACTEFHVIGPTALIEAVSVPDGLVAVPGPVATIAPVARASGKPKAKVSDIKDLVRSILKEQGKGGAFPINRLNAAVRETYDFSIAATDEKTWRGYLTKRPQLFVCDPKGPNAMVRLVSP
jgi:hypothetical protein